LAGLPEIQHCNGWGYDCFVRMDDVGTRAVYLADQANDILTNAFTLSGAELCV
jgi:hypothetical protein